MEEPDKQDKKQFDWLKEYQWQKGQSGNLKGRPKGQTLKEWGREFLMGMSEEARIDFVKEVGEKRFWEMVEGLPQQDVTSGGEKIAPQPIINVFPNHSDQQNNQDGKAVADSPRGDVGKQDDINPNILDSTLPVRQEPNPN